MASNICGPFLTCHRYHIICGLNPQAHVELTFRATDVERVGDVAGQTHVQRAAEAFVMWLGRWVHQYAVCVVELPTQWYDAALYPIIRLLTHKACVDTWKQQVHFLKCVRTHFMNSDDSDSRCTHQRCIHDRGISPWEPLTGQYTAGERLRNSGRHTPAGLLSSHTPAQTHNEKHADDLRVTKKWCVRSQAIQSKEYILSGRLSHLTDILL